MPNQRELSEELTVPSQIDLINQARKHYLKVMKQYTERNVIAYYSAFMQRPGVSGTSIDDNDKNAFMQMVSGIPRKEREKGLDLILHTPGGDLSATESLVYYLKSIFGNNIRTIVPQMAMSAGTMIALSTKEIIMGNESNLGPIDPQFGGISCSGVVEEFNRALKDVKENPESAAIWANIIGKYHPTFLGDCEKAIEWGESMVKKWLTENMFSDEADNEEKAKSIVKRLSSHETTFAHNRHIHMNDLKAWGVKIKALEDFPKEERENCKDLQDCILTLHHLYMGTLAHPGVNVFKIIETENDIMVLQANG